MEPDKSVVLIDAAEGQATFDKNILELLGHQVHMCHGPDDGVVCPILEEGGECDMFESAHGIVFELDLSKPQHVEILEKYQELATEGTPIRALVRPDQVEEYGDTLDGVELWTHDPTVGELDGFSARVDAQRQSTSG